MEERIRNDISGKKTDSSRHPEFIKMQEESAWKFPLDEERKARALTLIRQETMKKQIRHYPSFWETIWNQIRFQTWRHWVSQGSVLLAALLLVYWVREKAIGGRDSIAVCSVFLVLSGNICLSGVARLFSWHMAELEQTLYLNLKQRVCIRMLEAGLADALILGIVTGSLGSKAGVGTGAYLLYMLVPFLWSDTFYLHMLTSFRGIFARGFSGFWQISIGILCGMFSLFPVFWEDAYEAEYVIVWAVLLVTGFLALALEICKMFRKIERGESLCLN